MSHKKEECCIPTDLLDKVDEKLAILELAAEGAERVIEAEIPGDHRLHIGLIYVVRDVVESYRTLRRSIAGRM